MCHRSFTSKDRKPFHRGGVSTLKNEKYVIVAITVALTFLVVLSVQSYGSGWPGLTPRDSKSPMLDQSTSMKPSVMPAISTASKPSGTNVTVIGTVGTYTVAPTCRLSNPPCAIANTLIYYVNVNGRSYRLLFTNRTSVPEPLIGSNVVVTGLFVAPSAFRADQWTPLLYFFGDIHVQVITYFHTLPR